MDFKMRHEDGEVAPCDSCGCKAPTHDFRGALIDEPTRTLCEFCATTMAGAYSRYATGDEYTALRAEIWKAAACVFNMLKTPNAQLTGRGADTTDQRNDD